MRVIKPSAEEIIQKNLFEHIEICGRTCYKSTDKITEGSAEKFVKMLIKNNHGSVLEHGTVYLVVPFGEEYTEYNFLKLLNNKYTKHKEFANNYYITTNYRVIVENDFFNLMSKYQTEPTEHHYRRRTFKMVCNRSTSHEFVRHRVMSFAHECITGDTVIHPKGYTIKELYERFNYPQNSYDKTHNKTLRLKSCNEKNEIVYNKPIEILDKGIAPVYELTTKTGYKIKATENHKFLSKNNSYIKLGDLSVGDKVMVNGRPSLICITDEELVNLYKTMDVLSISQYLNCPPSSIRRKLHCLGIFEKRKNDSNKEKYKKNHTKESYKKGGNTRKEMYKNGNLTIWNKGLTEKESESVKKQANSLRKNHHNNGFGEKNSKYKNGIGVYRRDLSQIKMCEMCGNTENLEVHHLDKNRTNNDKHNLIKVCCKCHHMIHCKDKGKLKFKGIKCVCDEIISIKYVGEEHVYDVCMQDPLNNYVANGFVVHNSQRYVNYGKSKFGKHIKFIKPLYFEESSKEYMLWKINCIDSEDIYMRLLSYGCTPQEAREVLPNSTATELVMTGFESEWVNFFDLRCAKSAHPQAVEVANMVWKLF